MGKMIGGGFPVGALAGRAAVLDVMDPWADKVLFPHSGTFSANPVTMVAGLTAMELFDRAAVERLNKLGDYARESIRSAIAVAGITACVTGAGSMFRVHMKAQIPNNYREVYASKEEAQRISFMLDYLFDNGIIMINTCSGALSTPMTEVEIDTMTEVMLAGFRRL
jgi:glutamate-1-semialdehyde 2,1-aminomutase